MSTTSIKLETLAKERSPKEMRADCAKAFERAGAFHAEARSIFKYMMPWRQSTVERAPQGGGRSAGQPMMDAIFDGTALSAAANYPGLMMADWFPLYQDFMKLEAGPFLPAGVDRKERNELLAEMTQRVHSVSSGPKLAALEMWNDHFAGTGAMYVEKGDSETIVNAAAAPVVEIALEDGPWSMPWHIYWKRNYPGRDLPALWPNGFISNGLAQKIKSSPADPVEVIQYTYYEQKANVWRLAVWVAGDAEDGLIHERQTRTCPWMIPRMFKMPGESFGRGIAHLALPFAKTANRGRELALKAAVFAILGIWLRRNDGVFNPKTATFDPMAMWAVSSTGGAGALGASIQRLPVPQDFDISTIVMQEEREQMRRVMLDDELPDQQDPVRSATEIAAKLRRYSRNRGGTGARLNYEFHTPYVRRVCEILEDLGLVPRGISIDHIVTQCMVTAPAAAAQSSDKVERAINWIQMIVMLLGPQAAILVAKLDEMMPEIGRWMGVDERFINGKEEIKKLRDMLKEIVAQQQQQKAAANQPPPPPGQQYVNGGLQ